MNCQHKRYSVDAHEQTGQCIDCGAEGRMSFVVPRETDALKGAAAAVPMLLNALLTAEALLYAHGKPIDPAITAALVAAGARAA